MNASPLSKNIFDLLFAAMLVIAAGLGCGSNTPPPSQYVGNWSGDDGTTIAIRADGSADYRSGSSHITGGGVVIDEAEKTLKITFAGMGPKYKIEKGPSETQMTLDGVVFKKRRSGPEEEKKE